MLYWKRFAVNICHLLLQAVVGQKTKPKLKDIKLLCRDFCGFPTRSNFTSSSHILQLVKYNCSSFKDKGNNSALKCI